MYSFGAQDKLLFERLPVMPAPFVERYGMVCDRFAVLFPFAYCNHDVTGKFFRFRIKREKKFFPSQSFRLELQFIRKFCVFDSGHAFNLQHIVSGKEHLPFVVSEIGLEPVPEVVVLNQVFFLIPGKNQPRRQNNTRNECFHAFLSFLFGNKINRLPDTAVSGFILNPHNNRLKFLFPVDL